MRRLFIVCALAAAVLASAAGPDPFDSTMADVGLLQIKSVQTELKITDAQRTKMNVHADKHRKALQAYQAEVQKKKIDPAQAMNSARMAKIFGDLKSGVVGVLTAAQLKRLREISLQRAGTTAIGQTAVAKRIGLPDAQLKTFRAVFEADFAKAQKIRTDALKVALKEFEGKKPKSEAEAKALNEKAAKKAQAAEAKVAPQIVALAKQTEAKLLALLTNEQRKSWAALLGKPFAVK